MSACGTNTCETDLLEPEASEESPGPRPVQLLHGQARQHLLGSQSLAPQRQGVAGEGDGARRRERVGECQATVQFFPGDPPAGRADPPVFAARALAAGPPVVGNLAVLGGAQGVFALFLILSALAAPEDPHEAAFGDQADELLYVQVQARADQPPRPGVQGHPVEVRPWCGLASRRIVLGERVAGVHARRCRQ